MFTERSNDNIPADEMRYAADAARNWLAIQQSNEAFAKASAAKKRVMIAKDVLAWIAMHKLRPLLGNYLGVSPEPTATGAPEREIFGHKAPSEIVNGGSCHACALGALLACAAERSLVSTVNIEYGIVPRYSASIRAHLGPWFKEQQLIDVEAAFETDRTAPPGLRKADRGRREPEGSWRAIMFNHGHSSARVRMQRIMRNIIANRGTFKP